jgi:hypothetical protein
MRRSSRRRNEREGISMHHKPPELMQKGKENKKRR